jgi:hypothetical protein
MPRKDQISSSPIRPLNVSSLSTIQVGANSPNFAIARGTPQ